MNDSCSERQTTPSSKVNRRNVLTLLGASMASVAGCSGSGDGEPSGPENDGASGGGSSDAEASPTSDDGTLEGETGAQTDADGVSNPDFVTESDPYFGRVELDAGSGKLVIGLRPDQLGDEAVSELVMIDGRSDERLAAKSPGGGTVTFGATPWVEGYQFDQRTLTYPVTIRAANEFGDALAELQLDFTPEVEIGTVGMVHEHVDATEVSDAVYGMGVYFEIENPNEFPVYFEEGELTRIWSPDSGREFTARDVVSKTGQEWWLDVSSSYAVAGTGTTRGAFDSSATRWTAYGTDAPMDCSDLPEQSYDSELRFSFRGMSEPIVLPIRVQHGTENAYVDGLGGGVGHYCKGTTIDRRSE